MSALDRALDVLAAAPACDASYEPSGTNDPSKCWRCLGPAGTGASGVCDACREVLLGDGPIEPANEGWRSWEPFQWREHVAVDDRCTVCGQRLDPTERINGRRAALQGEGWAGDFRDVCYGRAPNLDVRLDGNGPTLASLAVLGARASEAFAAAEHAHAQLEARLAAAPTEDAMRALAELVGAVERPVYVWEPEPPLPPHAEPNMLVAERIAASLRDPRQMFRGLSS